MKDVPWVCLPFDSSDEALDKIEEVIPCQGFPTAGVVNKHGKIINAKLEMLSELSLAQW